MASKSTKKVKEKRFTLIVNMYQIRLLHKISECFLRERMGQFWILAEDLAGECAGYKYDNTDPDNGKKFNEFIDKRNVAEECFSMAYKMSGAGGLKTERMLQAEDFYEVIRHSIWLSEPEPKSHDSFDAYPPLLWSKEQPIPICSVDGKEDKARLFVTPVQLRLIQDMSECYMRERIGQFTLLADDLAGECVEVNRTERISEGSREPFDRAEEEDRWRERIARRNRALDVLGLGYRFSGAKGHKTKDMMQAFDLYEVTRHALWLDAPEPKDNTCLAAGEPLHECESEPLPVCEVAK